MKRALRRSWLLLTATGLAGCTLAPDYARPAMPVAAVWPGVVPAAGEAEPPVLGYREIVRDERLAQLIDAALANNRDLRIAVANMAAARALYRQQAGQLLPRLDIAADHVRTSDPPRGQLGQPGGQLQSVSLATVFELDLFGRVRSLSEAAQSRYLASEAGAQAVRVTLIADVAEAWFVHAADRSLLATVEQTATNAEAAATLVRHRHQAGIAPRSELRQAETLLAATRAEAAALRAQIGQSRNALVLLVGAPFDDALLATAIEDVGDHIVPAPAGLSSAILLRRPDVIQAEYELQASYAEIGAARAALFPRLSLTGLAGVASPALRTLFSGDSFVWSGGVSATAPLFQGGSGRAGVDVSLARRDAALAAYERTIQAAFRDVADALARQSTIDDQLEAQGQAYGAALDSEALAAVRYRAGVVPFLESLDAQRTLYAVERDLIAARLALVLNRVAIYRALAGEAVPRD